MSLVSLDRAAKLANRLQNGLFYLLKTTKRTAVFSVQFRNFIFVFSSISKRRYLTTTISTLLASRFVLGVTTFAKRVPVILMGIN